jgi:hypothetical protein
MQVSRRVPADVLVDEQNPHTHLHVSIPKRDSGVRSRADHGRGLRGADGSSRIAGRDGW